ncbi:DUF2953 domain-containing protein [Mahella sp.]|uniref:DUF2953 domain-containing protein n=1 Tax=Mahella sp. TaxID=2798721 RepID=UPI0025BAED6C|nr:DUF2953 domain-containing protein [Mahella sp.]MBZ4665747.1 hypothetical protein [Mahella sp.]
MWLLIVSIVGAAIALLCLSTIEFEIKIFVNNAENYLFISMRWLKGLVTLRYNISIGVDSKKRWRLLIRKTDNAAAGETPLQKVVELIKRWISSAKGLKAVILYILGRVRIPYIQLHMSVGLYDAAVTAILTGSIQSLVYILFSYAKIRIMIGDADISIKPNYAGDNITVHGDGIVRLRLGHIIIASIKALKIIIANKIKAVIKNGRTASYTRHNAYHHGEY